MDESYLKLIVATMQVVIISVGLLVCANGIPMQ